MNLLVFMSLPVALFPGTWVLNAQESAMKSAQESALETTRRIADKVIRETSFEYEMVPLTFNGGIIRCTLEKDASGETEGVTYARAVFQADEDTDGYLGLSFSGELALFLNGRELFRGSSDQCGTAGVHLQPLPFCPEDSGAMAARGEHPAG